MSFYWYPVDAFQDLVASGTGEKPGEGDSNYTSWLDKMRTYQQDICAIGEPKHFWIVLGLPKDDYSQKLEWHKEMPMVVPTPGEGKLVGIASSKEQVDALIASDQKNVHLVFKAKIHGEKAWRRLLDFLGAHAMLDKEG